MCSRSSWSRKAHNSTLSSTLHSRKQMKSYWQLKNDKEDVMSRLLMESRKIPREWMINIWGYEFYDRWKRYQSKYPVMALLYALQEPANPRKSRPRSERCHTSQDDVVNVEEFIANITDTTLEQMHYLHAALTETLRLYPAVPVVNLQRTQT